MKAKPAQLEVEDASGESGRKRRRSQNLDDDVKGQESAKSQKSGKGSARGDDDSPRSPRTPRSLTSPRYKGKELKGTSIPKSAKRVSSGSKVDFKDKNADPPRRVQKNPHFLQEHRDRYLDRTQSEGKFDQAPHKKNAKRKFLHGNYDTYYNYRNPGASDDPRIQVLAKEWFEGKRALDIGCNSGAVTIELARRFTPRHILGVDIDPSLVHKARSNLKFVAAGLHGNAGAGTEGQGGSAADKLTGGEESQPSKVPVSVVSHKGVETRPSRAPPPSHLPDPDLHPFDFPYNCSFRKEDYVTEPDIDADYDCILCLSVTKWVHFNLGDEGIKQLFAKVYRALNPGGRFVLELQEWSSYKKKKALTEQFKKNCAAIQIRPEMFREYLLKDVGFKECTELKPPKGKSEGFARPLFSFRK